jgi:zinc and cadmium transporter
MWPTALLVIYCLLLILASLLGGWLPMLVRLTHTRMQLMMSFVGGLMLGVALLHLLPHAVVETGSLDWAAWSCLAGLLVMFLVIRVFHVHQHAPDAQLRPAAGGSDDHHATHCQHDHSDDQPCVHSHRLSWLGLFMGMAIHSLIDGVAVAASLVVAAEHDGDLWLLGAGTFLAVLFHKPLDSLSITSVMAAGEWSKRMRNLVNAAFSVTCPLGALAFYFGTRELVLMENAAVGCALGFSAGVFLCISLADILPEIQFHRHDRVKLFTALLVGVALAFAIGIFEPQHAHEMQGPHDDHDHDHSHSHSHAEVFLDPSPLPQDASRTSYSLDQPVTHITDTDHAASLL